MRKFGPDSLQRAWIRLLGCLLYGLLAVFALAQAPTPIRQKITVGVNADYPPYEFLDEKGEPAGFDIDIIRAAAYSTYINPKIQSGAWNDLRADLKAKRIHLLAGMLYSDERDKEVEFGAPYLLVDYSIFVRSGTTRISKVEDLRSKSVLVEEGSQMHDELKRAHIRGIIPVASEPEALRQLAAGKGDAALVPLLEGLSLSKSASLANVESSGAPVFSRNLCFAASKGNNQLIGTLNTGLAIIKGNGEYDEIYDKWFGNVLPSPSPWPRIVLWLAVGSTVVALALGFGLVWANSLRKQVKARTADLNEQLVEKDRIRKELEASEEKYKALFEHASDGIYLANEQMVLVDVNVAGCKLSGKSRDELIGNHVTTFFDAEHLQERPVRFDDLKRGVSTITERVALRGDGTKLLVESSAKMVAPGLFQTIVRDITARKEQEKQLVEDNELLEQRVSERTAELEQAYKELEGYTYSIAHDLRAPLRAMDGFATILLREHSGELSSVGTAHLARICANSKQMALLIDSLLGYARIARQSIQKSEVDLALLAEGAWAELKKHQPECQLNLNVHPLPAVQADEKLLRLVLLNLLDNSMKFCKPNLESNVELGFDKETSAFYLKDQGIGFDPEYTNKLFKVFERLHGKEFEGAGVGLATVLRIIEKHNGKAWAEGAVDKGTTIWFTLPT